MSLVQCVSCREQRRILARGLCRRCYDAHRSDGTLDDFPKTAPKVRASPCTPIGPRVSPAPLPSDLGVSYRQVDYWVTRGWLQPRNASAGTGSLREWPDGEVRVLRMMARLVQAGLPPAMAHDVARAGGSAEVAPGVRVEVDRPLILAAMAADHLGEPLADMPQAHRAALVKVEWPDA